MPQGLIVKALSGYYYVWPDQASDTLIQCRARGIFKKKGISPLVGDKVIFNMTENGEGTVDEVLTRSTELIRPPIANVDLVALIFSLHEPELNVQLLDKFLVHTEKADLETVICLTKSDLWEAVAQAGDKKELERIVGLYERIGYPVIVTSAKTGTGVTELLDRLTGRIAVFAGQSGVGKSSLLNAIVPGLSLETNEISSKLGRGKHTTRHVELIRLQSGGLVADTPGFSQLDFLEIEASDLSGCFREMAELSANCKFRGCLHLHEPGCAVLDGVQSGWIAKSRYEHYVQFLTEVKEKKRRY